MWSYPIMIIMRNIGPGEYYHIFNRGNDKRTIFNDERDWIRFLFLILHLQSPEVSFPQLGREVTKFVRRQRFDIEEETLKEIIKGRQVELVAFCLMPNHFHLILGESEEGGITHYMQRVESAYAKYFNIKYTRVGHLFQGRYKSVHIEDDSQLLYLSAYIHRNPRELKNWKGKEHEYPWSTYQDYLGNSRWGGLLVSDIILGQYSNVASYKKDVEMSRAKELDEELLLD